MAGGGEGGAMQRQGGRMVVSAVVLVLGITTIGTGEGRADTGGPGTFEARATAEGGRMGLTVPGFAVVEQIIDGGGPVADARTDVLGNSKAFASLPYPGENGINGPSNVTGLAGLPTPPPYPFYAGSAYPLQPESSMNEPGWTLHAKSEEFASEATAAGGADDQSAAFGHVATHAVAHRDPGTGAVVSEASSTVTGFRIADVLKIAAVTVSARAARTSLDAVERASAFRVEGLLIGGQAVAVGETGLTLPGGSAPLPDSSPVLAALKGQGITISYVRARKDEEGVTSAGLLITQEMRSPSGQTLRFTYSFGRASAQVPSQSFG
jgi:hypothetical protein